MNVNQVLLEYQALNNISFKDGNSIMPDNLKVKIVSCIIEYGKVFNNFKQEILKYVSELNSKHYLDLQKKQSENDLTEDEKKELETLTKDNFIKYDSFVSDLLNSDVDCKKFILSKDEFNEIVKVNAGNNVVINEQEMKSTEYLEFLYSLFVK